MLYNYLVTVYKVIVGLVTPERLIAVALGALGIYLVWMSISLVASFQRRFNSKCQELINFTIRTKEIEKQPELLDKMAENISSGFGFGWKKFRGCEVGKPSDFITRRESLEVEINGGLLNNGKTMMRAYISFITFVLAIFNFAYVGGDNPLTFMVFAESLVFPLVFFVVIKLFYFLHNSIKQKLYRMDIESFYEVIDLLDSKFVKKGRIVAVEGEEVEEETEEEKTEEDEVLEEEPEEAEEEDSLDKYDFFKKKNIDVSKLMNETPKADSTLPYINVDSDYVIKDDEQVGSKQVGQDDNMSTIFGGMLQNTSGLKKNTFVDIEKGKAEIDEDKLEKLSAAANEVIEAEEKSEEEPVVEEPKEEAKPEEKPVVEEPKVEEKPVTFEEKKFGVEVNINEDIPFKKNEKLNNIEDEVDLTPNSNKFIEIEKNEKEDYSLQEENIANVVSGFKANRSKLASGGMVIERNQPIARRERTGFFAENNNIESAVVEQPQPVYEQPKPEVTRPVAEDNTESVLNTLKTGGSGYDAGYTGNQVFAPSTNYGSMGYDQAYGYNAQPMYQQPQMGGYAYGNQQTYPSYNQSAYGMGMQDMSQGQVYEEYEDEIEEDVVDDTPKKKKVVRTKENEPRPRNLKSNSKKSVKEEAKEVEKRGRPKKQEVSENMVIENDKQFNEVLARAEKLMRKNEQGLSESQSKRIEKEIKILMDAMNKYKESK